MRAALVALVALILAGCATRPLSYEDDDVIVIKGQVLLKRPNERTPEQTRAITAHYTAPVFDDRERRMWKHLLTGHGLDVATTVVALNAGCVETLPGLGRHPNILALLAVKALPLVHWWHHAHRSPAAFSSADSLVSRVNVMSGYGAAAWNASVIVLGVCNK